MKKSSEIIDTREYDDCFLLAKILIEVNLTKEEKEKLMKKFKKVRE